MTLSVSTSFSRTQKPAYFALLIFLSSALISCTNETRSGSRGIASESESVSPVEAPAPTANSYDLVDMIKSVSASRSSDGEFGLVGGFLAATAEDIIKSTNLSEIISSNANRACVLLGQIHGKKHKRAVGFELSEQVGPMMSPETGEPRQQRAVPISQHEKRQAFCAKVASFEPEEQRLYGSKCLEATSIEVMPLHFTALECDSALDGEGSYAPVRGSTGPAGSPGGHHGGSPPTTR